ncbi:membrane-bound lytic murein transglycosylase B [Methylophilaceae bacterium]|nr:membrane-bound lytic murein transglycosylase B [Methylophilaceae bacterium]
MMIRKAGKFMLHPFTVVPPRWFLTIGLAVALNPSALADGADGSLPYHERGEVLEFVAEMAERHGFDAIDLREVFAGVEFQPSVIKAMEPPASPNVRSWERYRPRFVNQARIDRGVRFMQAYAEELKRARQMYGVPEEIIAAIIGVETIYGQNTGKYRVIDALTTLAFDYPRRAEYFRGELEQYLLMAREQQLDYFSVLGSYAGAIGLPQFMPTNVRQLAVDFDSDGRVDLRSSAVDAIGSVAHYLAVHGWLTDAPVASHVSFHDPVPDSWLETILPTMTKDDIKDVRFNTKVSLDEHMNFAVIPLDTPEKMPEFWLGFNNFYVITRYNKSTFYAMSVLQLAQALKAQR